MEKAYGIGIANRYAILDDEADPFDAIKQKQEVDETKKKSKIVVKENREKVENNNTLTNKANKQSSAIKSPPKDIKVSKPLPSKRDDVKVASQKLAMNVTAATTVTTPQAADRPSKLSNENRDERSNRRNRDEKGASTNERKRMNEWEEKPSARKGAGESNNYNNNDSNGEHKPWDRNERFGERNDRFGERGDRSDRFGGNRNNSNASGKSTAPGSKPYRKPFEDKRGKREFDRQSGSDKTGVKAVDKRDGGGSHNWGSHKDVIDEADKSLEREKSWNDSGFFAKTGDASPEATEIKDETEADANPSGEERKELTLDEWKAQRATRAKPKFNTRKAGEGEDPSQWKTMYELPRKDVPSESEEEYDLIEYPQRVGRQKHVLGIDIQFNDQRFGNISRGRGGTRGQRNTGPNRGSGTNGIRGGSASKPLGGERTEKQFKDHITFNGKEDSKRAAPKVDDERDFPSLG